MKKTTSTLTLIVVVAMMMMTLQPASAGGNGKQVATSSGDTWKQVGSQELEVTGQQDGVLAFQLPEQGQIRLQVAFTGVYLTDGGVHSDDRLYRFEEDAWQLREMNDGDGDASGFVMTNTIRSLNGAARAGDGADGTGDGADGAGDGADGAGDGADIAGDGADGAGDGAEGGDGGSGDKELLRVELRVSMGEADRSFESGPHTFDVEGLREAKVDIVLTPTESLVAGYVYLEQKMLGEVPEGCDCGMGIDPMRKGDDVGPQNGHMNQHMYDYGDSSEGEAMYQTGSGSSLGYYRWSVMAQHKYADGTEGSETVDALVSEDAGTVVFGYRMRDASSVVHDPAVGMDEAAVAAALEEFGGEAVDYVREHMVSIMTGIVVGIVLIVVMTGYLGRKGRRESLDPSENPYFRRPSSP